MIRQSFTLKEAWRTDATVGQLFQGLVSGNHVPGSSSLSPVSPRRNTSKSCSEVDEVEFLLLLVVPSLSVPVDELSQATFSSDFSEGFSFASSVYLFS